MVVALSGGAWGAIGLVGAALVAGAFTFLATWVNQKAMKVDERVESATGAIIRRLDDCEQWKEHHLREHHGVTDE